MLFWYQLWNLNQKDIYCFMSMLLNSPNVLITMIVKSTAISLLIIIIQNMRTINNFYILLQLSSDKLLKYVCQKIRKTLINIPILILFCCLRCIRRGFWIPTFDLLYQFTVSWCDRFFKVLLFEYYFANINSFYQ